MEKLFMITIGGSIKNANLEVHSLQFVIGETIEDTFPHLLKRWYGDALHLDGYKEFKAIDGYQVNLDGSIEENLYAIVYGGYHPSVIDELHDYTFVIAQNPTEAKKLAKEKLHQFENMDHVDEVVDVFQNAGKRFGLIKKDVRFKDEAYTHQFVKLK